MFEELFKKPYTVRRYRAAPLVKTRERYSVELGAFEEWMRAERCLAEETIGNTFKLLVPFACAELGKQDYQLTVPNLSSELVRRFLDHLEDERGCCTYTRNLRLTAIRAFARFVANRDPAHVVWHGQSSAIASKKTTTKPVAWLSVDEMHALLDVPDRTTRHGRIEHAILLFLYKTGARVSEATQLRVGDLQV